MKSIFSVQVYLAISGFVFFLVAALHLFRLIFHWPMIVGTLEIPFFFSFTGFPTAAAYSVWAFWLFRKNKK